MIPPTPVWLINARLIDPATGYDGPGAIKLFGKRIDEVVRGENAALSGQPAPARPRDDRRLPEPGDRVVDCRGLPLAPGIVDMRVFVGEPGARHRESLKSAGEAAAAGGVTTIVVQPDTTPPLDDPALVQFVRARGAEVSKVRVEAMGALTRGLEGREMTEQRFLLDAGAVALTDCDRAIPDAIVMHPGPMNRGVEIDAAVADDVGRSVIRDQVEMGVAVRMAAMDLLARNIPAEAT